MRTPTAGWPIPQRTDHRRVYVISPPGPAMRLRAAGPSLVGWRAPQLTNADGTGDVRETAAQVGASMREMAGEARRGIVTVIEKIDPDTLADLIIKATAIQEVTNAKLARKGAAYRIGDNSIAATIPPQIGFAISRIGDVEAPVDPHVLKDSTELHVDGDEAVLSLDGEVLPD